MILCERQAKFRLWCLVYVLTQILWNYTVKVNLNRCCQKLMLKSHRASLAICPWRTHLSMKNLVICLWRTLSFVHEEFNSQAQPSIVAEDTRHHISASSWPFFFLLHWHRFNFKLFIWISFVELYTEFTKVVT